MIKVIKNGLVVTMNEKNEIKKCLEKIKTTFELTDEEPLIAFSSEKKQGIDRVWQMIDEMLEDR